MNKSGSSRHSSSRLASVSSGLHGSGDGLEIERRGLDLDDRAVDAVEEELAGPRIAVARFADDRFDDDFGAGALLLGVAFGEVLAEERGEAELGFGPAAGVSALTFDEPAFLVSRRNPDNCLF